MGKAISSSALISEIKVYIACTLVALSFFFSISSVQPHRHWRIQSVCNAAEFHMPFTCQVKESVRNFRVKLSHAHVRLGIEIDCSHAKRSAEDIFDEVKCACVCICGRTHYDTQQNLIHCESSDKTLASLACLNKLTVNECSPI